MSRHVQIDNGSLADGNLMGFPGQNAPITGYGRYGGGSCYWCGSVCLLDLWSIDGVSKNVLDDSKIHRVITIRTKRLWLKGFQRFLYTQSLHNRLNVAKKKRSHPGNSTTSLSAYLIKKNAFPQTASITSEQGKWCFRHHFFATIFLLLLLE